MCFSPAIGLFAEDSDRAADLKTALEHDKHICQLHHVPPTDQVRALRRPLKLRFCEQQMIFRLALTTADHAEWEPAPSNSGMNSDRQSTILDCDQLHNGSA